MHRNSKLNFKLSANLSNNFVDGELAVDAELITSDDLTILSTFLETKEAQLHIRKLSLLKNPAPSTERGMKHPSRVKAAASSAVFRVCVDFIARSRRLVGVSFEGLVLAIESMNRLGTAISRTKSRELCISIERGTNAVSHLCC